MSHFGRSGPPDIKDSYSLLVLNITFRTTADDLFPLFDKYGKVVDVFIPRNRRTGDSRGFAFVRFKYEDEAHKAVEKLDGRVVDGREIMVQFAKYGPNAEKIHKGRIVESFSKTKGRSRSRSPRPRYRDDYRDKDYRRSRSRSRGRYDREGHRGRERDYHHRSLSHSPDKKDHRGDRYDEGQHSRSPSHGSASPARRDKKDHRRDRYNDGQRSRSPSHGSASPARHSPYSKRSPLHGKHPRVESPDGHNHSKRSPTRKSISPRGQSSNS